MSVDSTLELLDRVSVAQAAVAQYQRRVADRIVEARMVGTKGKELEGEVLRLCSDADLYADVSALLQTFSEEEQKAVQTKFEFLISYGLRFVFGDAFKAFKLNAGVERGQVSARPTVVFEVDGGIEVTSGVMDAHGGGPADVIGFMLRLLVVIFSAKDTRPVLLLDETFTHLSDEFLPAMGALVRKFVDELGRDLQIVLVTHQADFLEYADAAYRFRLEPGSKHTKVERTR